MACRCHSRSAPLPRAADTQRLSEDISLIPNMDLPKYIIVEFGIPHVAEALPDAQRMNRLAVIRRTWEHVHAFDAKLRYRQVVIDPPNYGIVSSILTYIYNPFIDVKLEWQSCGRYDKSFLISLVEEGLEHDDDIIQQWFGADGVIKLLESALSWDDTILAVKAVGGAHNVCPEVQRYVERILGGMNETHPQFAELVRAIRSLVESGVPAELEIGAFEHGHETHISYDGQLSTWFGVPPSVNLAALEADFADYQLAGPFDYPLTNPFTKQKIPYWKFTLAFDRNADKAAKAALLILAVFGVPPDAPLTIFRP